MQPPASVPSWWGFNQAVLEGLRSHYVASDQIPTRAAAALARLSLNALDVTDVSQVVHNAFAGLTWFELLGVLDGVAPNTTHRTLARLAAHGPLRAVITTNFDTLLERSLPLGTVCVDAPVDDPPAGQGLSIVKLHGTATRSASLVDLSAQKRRGLRPAWRRWLASTFATHAVLVLGFSGADLDLGEDYLSLHRASTSTPWLGWNLRANATPHPQAHAAVMACGSRGHFVVGDLPQVLCNLGVPLDEVPDDELRPDQRLADAVDTWLAQPHVDAAVCAVALARLLDDAGAHYAATAIRSRVRTRTRKSLRVGLDIELATRAAQILGQVGTDDHDPRRALRDLDLADRALDSVVAHLGGGGGLNERSHVEYALGKSFIAQNMALRHIRQGDAKAAQAQLDRAAPYLAAIPIAERGDRVGAQLEYSAAISWLRGDTARAKALFRDAHAAALASGHRERILSTEKNLRLPELVAADDQPTCAGRSGGDGPAVCCHPGRGSADRRPIS
jgi:hypothetical protein